MTTKTTWGDPYDKWFITYWGAKSRRTERIWIFFSLFGYHAIGNRWRQSTFTDVICRGIISYTSYSRTNDCIYNGYDNINLEPNAMNNIDTVAHMNMHYTQYWEHWALFIDAYRVTSHRGSSPPCTRHPIHACAPVCVALWLFLFTRLLFLFVPLLFFRPFQMSSSEFHEKLKSKSLCDFRLGTVATSDHETPLTWSVFKHVHLKTTRVSMLNRLMMDQFDLINTQLQYKKTLKYVMRPKRSTPTMRQSGRELRRTWTSKLQDHHILLWSNCRVPAFENLFRKLRTTQIDMFFNETYDRVNHLIPSVQYRKKWFMKLGTSNCVNCSRRNPNHSAKCVYHSGTLVYSIARAGISCIKKEGRISNSSIIRWTFFQFQSISSRKDDLMDIDTVRSRETRNTTSPTSWRRSARRGISRVSMTGLYEMSNSAVEWLEMVATKIFVDKWMILRTKIIPTICHHKNITITKVMGGFVRTRQFPILCQCSADLTSNKHCLRCSHWRRKKNKLNETNDGNKVLLLRRFLVDSSFLWKSPWGWTKYWLRRLGVLVFTHTVGYNRPSSAVNDPSVTK